MESLEVSEAINKDLHVTNNIILLIEGRQGFTGREYQRYVRQLLLSMVEQETQ